MPAIEGGFVEVAPYPEAERLPELNPELYNNTNRMKLYVFANDDAGAGGAARRLRQSRQGRLGRRGAEPQPDAGRRGGHELAA